MEASRHDDTQHLHARIRDLESQVRFGQELLNLLPLPAFCEDENGRYISCNQAFCDFMERPKEEILSKTVVEISDSPAARSYFERDQQMIDSELSFEVVERVMRRGNGEYRNVAIYKSLLTDRGRVRGIIAVLLDITDLKEAQSREEFYREKLVTLTSAFAVAKEQERCRIAQEIHDSISQSLALSKLQLKLMGTHIDESLQDELNAVVETINYALEYTRTLTFELGVPVLYQLGLNAALHWLKDELLRKHDFHVHYRSKNLPGNMDDNLKAFLFRSAQELLMNAVKHSGADEAFLDIEGCGNRLVVRVHDQGQGFDAYKLSNSDLSSKTYGLFNLETLVRSLGGSVHIRSEPGHGADIALQIPIPEDRDQSTGSRFSPLCSGGHFE